jgi:hypothetical protein
MNELGFAIKEKRKKKKITQKQLGNSEKVFQHTCVL